MPGNEHEWKATDENAAMRRILGAAVLSVGAGIAAAIACLLSLGCIIFLADAPVSADTLGVVLAVSFAMPAAFLFAYLILSPGRRAAWHALDMQWRSRENRSPFDRLQAHHCRYLFDLTDSHGLIGQGGASDSKIMLCFYDGRTLPYVLADVVSIECDAVYEARGRSGEPRPYECRFLIEFVGGQRFYGRTLLSLFDQLSDRIARSVRPA